MSTDPNQFGPLAPMDGRVEGELAATGRVELRMLKDGQLATVDDVAELFRQSNEIGWTNAEIAKRTGYSGSVVSEARRGAYRGDLNSFAHRLDHELARESGRQRRENFEDPVLLRITEIIAGACNLGDQLRTHVAIGIPSGGGKTTFALAHVASSPGATYLRLPDAAVDARSVSALLCENLKSHRGANPLAQYRDRSHTKRMQALRDYIKSRPSQKWVFDESQLFTRAGLECVRHLAEAADPSGHRRIPCVFFGDETFLKVINQTRAGKTTRISPQIASRFFPVLSFEAIVKELGGQPYSVDDICRIVRNSRVKLLTAETAKWLTMLANIGGCDGLLRRAITVLKAAMRLYCKSDAARLSVENLQEALHLACGREIAVELDAMTGGQLLAKAG